MSPSGARRHSRPSDLLWPATAIMLAAAVLRLAWLHDIPPGLSQDEVLNADVAGFIRLGRHAIFFREGFGHEPLYHYWSVPFQVLLGDHVLSIRLPAVFLGLLLVAVAMRWAWRDFGRPAALVTGLGLAVGWWPIVFSRVGIRPILEPLLLVLAVWHWPRRAWLTGLFLGLSVYSYTAARFIFLMPLVLAAYLFVAPRRNPDRSLPPAGVPQALVAFLVSAVMYLPLAFTLRADPSLQQRVDQLAEPLNALLDGNPEPVMGSALSTLGVFTFTGDPRWTYSLPDRPLFDPLTGLLFYAGLGLVIWRWRRPKYGLVLIWLALTMLPSAITPDAPSTVRLVGAMPVVYLLPGLAISFLWTRRERILALTPLSVQPLRRAVSLVLLSALIALNLWRTVSDGFIRWPAAEDTRLKYQTVMLDMARYWRAHPVRHLVVADAFVEPIDLDSFRRNLNRANKSRWVQLGAAVDGALVLPAGADEIALYVPEFAPVPVALLDAVSAGYEPAYRSRGEPSFAAYTFSPSTALGGNLPGTPFENTATLIGHDILASDGQEVRLLTSWRVDSPWPADLAIFIHLVDWAGVIVAQHDGLDAYARSLRPGDRVIQLHILDLPDDLPPGPLSLQAGLYERATGRRLLHDGDPPDQVILASGLRFD